jgi:hypothetical protein
LAAIASVTCVIAAAVAWITQPSWKSPSEASKTAP